MYCKHAGLPGAKITGGGSGGTVVVIGSNSADCEEKVETIAKTYAQEKQAKEIQVDKNSKLQSHTPYIFRGSSPGAADFDILMVQYSGFRMMRKMYKKYALKSKEAGSSEASDASMSLFCW